MLPHGRFIAPVTAFAMAPTNRAKDHGGQIQKGLSNNVGPFYGPEQAKEWVEELRKKEYAQQNTFNGYDVKKHPELYTQEHRAMNSGRLKKKEEYDRTVPGGFGELGPEDDKIRVYASALSGTINSHSPRFLETLVETPAHRENKFTKGRGNILLLGFEPCEQPKPSSNTTDLGYNPLNHEYRADAPNKTALQKRAMRERTGYVSVAGGKKGKSEFGDRPSAMKAHVENDYSRIPATTRLEDENACLNNSLRCVPTKHGHGEETKELMQFDKFQFPDRQAEEEKYSKQFQKQIELFEREKKKQKETNLKTMEHQYTFLDPFTEHLYGINHGRVAKPLEGYNPIMDRPNQIADEIALRAQEEREMLHKIEQGKLKKVKMESRWDIVTNCDKLTGEEHMTPHYVKKLSQNEIGRIKKQAEAGIEMQKMIQHAHQPSPPANYHGMEYAIKIGNHEKYFQEHDRHHGFRPQMRHYDPKKIRVHADGEGNAMAQMRHYDPSNQLHVDQHKHEGHHLHMRHYDPENLALEADQLYRNDRLGKERRHFDQLLLHADHENDGTERRHNGSGGGPSGALGHIQDHGSVLPLPIAKKKKDDPVGHLIFGKFSEDRAPATTHKHHPGIFEPMVDTSLKMEQRRAAPFKHKYFFPGQKDPQVKIEGDRAPMIGGKLGDAPKEYFMPTPPKKKPLTEKVTPLSHRKTGEMCRVQSPPRIESNEGISKFGVVVPSTRVEYDRRWIYKKFGEFGVQSKCQTNFT